MAYKFLDIIHQSNSVYLVKIHPVFYYNKNPTKSKNLTTDFLMFL